MNTTTEPPPGLAARGRAYWQTVIADYDLSASELAILIEACRTLDNLDQLAEAIARDGATVLGSAGQTVVHPALTEARGQRLALHRLVSALALPDVEGQSVPSTGSLRAKHAATVRWAGHRKDVS